MQRIVLWRHGRTTWNAEHRFQGQTDIPLDDLGLRQAERAAQALAMLADPSNAEREVLSAISYQPNEAVLHTDTRLLPRRCLAWAAWNYHLDGDASRVALTYNMNILQSLDAPAPFLVTLNRTDAIDPRKIVKRLHYEHPLFTPEAVAAQARHSALNGQLSTYYCGAWWRNGFHEDGVVSALAALRHFGERHGRTAPVTSGIPHDKVISHSASKESLAHAQRALHRAA